MFNFNFNGDCLNVPDVVYTTDDNDDGQVLGTATATLPTLVMNVFDMDTVDLDVDCMAELQIGNADIMFVLDTTGSMGNSKLARASRPRSKACAMPCRTSTRPSTRR